VFVTKKLECLSLADTEIMTVVHCVLLLDLVLYFSGIAEKVVSVCDKHTSLILLICKLHPEMLVGLNQYLKIYLRRSKEKDRSRSILNF